MRAAASPRKAYESAQLHHDEPDRQIPGCSVDSLHALSWQSARRARDSGLGTPSFWPRLPTDWDGYLARRAVAGHHHGMLLTYRRQDHGDQRACRPGGYNRMLSSLDRGVIIGREFLISGCALLLRRRGFTIEASDLAS